jgi:hypothetical protein
LPKILGKYKDTWVKQLWAFLQIPEIPFFKKAQYNREWENSDNIIKNLINW